MVRVGSSGQDDSSERGIADVADGLCDSPAAFDVDGDARRDADEQQRMFTASRGRDRGRNRRARRTTAGIAALTRARCATTESAVRG
jgi:hypothetical protein